MSIVVNEISERWRGNNRIWRTERGGTTSWHGRWRIGRVRFGFDVHRHCSHLPTRWVFQPALTYDWKVA